MISAAKERKFRLWREVMLFLNGEGICALTETMAHSSSR